MYYIEATKGEHVILHSCQTLEEALEVLKELGEESEVLSLEKVS